MTDQSSAPPRFTVAHDAPGTHRPYTLTVRDEDDPRPPTTIFLTAIEADQLAKEITRVVPLRERIMVPWTDESHQAWAAILEAGREAFTDETDEEFIRAIEDPSPARLAEERDAALAKLAVMTAQRDEFARALNRMADLTGFGRLLSSQGE